MNGVVRTIAFTLLASAAAAVLVFPRATPGVPNPQPSLRRAASVAFDRARFHRELLYREESRLLARADGAPPPAAHELFALRNRNAPTFLEQRVRERMTRVMSRLARRDSSVRVAIVLSADGDAGVSRSAGGVSYGVSYDAFTAAAPNTCTVVIRFADSLILSGRRAWNPVSAFDPQSTCMRYAAYGMPGHGVQSWLDSTGYALFDRRFSAYEAFERGSELGLRSQLDAPYAACSSGRPGACASLVFGRQLSRWYSWFDWYDGLDGFSGLGDWTPLGAANVDGWAGSNRSHHWSAGGFAVEMVARMEREFGTDAFATIWKSDRPFAESFAAQRGESLDAWLQRQINGPRPRYHPGPIPGRPLSYVLLLFIPAVLALGVAGVVQRNDFA